MNTREQWKLVSVEDQRRFMIVSDGHRHIAQPQTILSQENAPGWDKKGRSAKELWESIASEREQSDTRVMVAAPELLAALKDVVRISDRQHEAWDRARDVIARAEGRA